MIIEELNLTGAFIQEIVQPGYDTISFRVINKGAVSTILICTAPQACRISRTKCRPPKNEKPLRFNEFLKSRIQGMRINSCRQLGLDRIILLDVSTWKERLFMYARLWSNAANIIVTDENGTILDCMYRRPGKGEISGGQYSPQEIIPSDEEQKAALEKFPVRSFSSLNISEEQQSTLSFNEKIDLYYSEHASSLSKESLLEQAEKWYNAKRGKMEHALQNLLEKKARFENAEAARHTGDLILSFASQIQGFSLDCIDYATGEKVHIQLDEKKTPQENAAAYYGQYRKSVSGKDALEHDIELSRKAIASLDAEYKKISSEQNTLKIEQLLRRSTAPRQHSEKKHPGLQYEIEGWTLIVGRTAAENDELLRHFVKGQDMWLHTRDYAGGYVFIKARKGKSIPLEILLYAGNLAVHHSKARKNGSADLYYTQVKYLRRAKNGPKGLVIPTQEKNLYIKTDEARLRKLDEIEKFKNYL